MRLTGLGSDLRFALRLVRADWRFSATLVATLAIGIAASGALFNVVNATLLRPLPIPDEARVYRLQDYTLGRDGRQVRRSNRVLNFLAIRDEARSFSQVVGMRSVEWSLIDGGIAGSRIAWASCRRDRSRCWACGAQLGRLPTPDEERARSRRQRACVLSHSLWQRQFGGRPDVVGRTVRVEDRVATVIGVAAARASASPTTWRRGCPSASTQPPRPRWRCSRGSRQASTRPQAQAELDAIAARAEAIRPVVNRGVGFAMTPVRESLVGDSARTSLALMGAAVLLLVLASANVANLLLARGIRRAKEIAVRAALGAERARQVRQMLVESLVFAALGTALGLAVAHPAQHAAGRSRAQHPARSARASPKPRSTCAPRSSPRPITAVVGVLAGLVPALKLARADVSDTLRQHTPRRLERPSADARAGRRRGGAGRRCCSSAPG